MMLTILETIIFMKNTYYIIEKFNFMFDLCICYTHKEYF